MLETMEICLVELYSDRDLPRFWEFSVVFRSCRKSNEELLRLSELSVLLKAILSSLIVEM